jgi:topoisomerase-4 subunit B
LPHLAAFREAFVKTIRDFYKKDYDAQIYESFQAISMRVRSGFRADKTKLGSLNVFEGGPTMKNFVGKFFQNNSTTTCIKPTAKP